MPEIPCLAGVSWHGDPSAMDRKSSDRSDRSLLLQRSRRAFLRQHKENECSPVRYFLSPALPFSALHEEVHWNTVQSRYN